jgi:hypothetical protein
MDSEEQPVECVPSCALGCCHAALTHSPRARRSSCCACDSDECDEVDAGRRACLLPGAWGAMSRVRGMTLSAESTMARAAISRSTTSERPPSDAA